MPGRYRCPRFGPGNRHAARLDVDHAGAPHGLHRAGVPDVRAGRPVFVLYARAQRAAHRQYGISSLLSWAEPTFLAWPANQDAREFSAEHNQLQNEARQTTQPAIEV